MDRGQVRVSKVTRGVNHPHLDNFKNILPISHVPKWNQLSPMKLGPVIVTEPVFNGVVHPGFTYIGNDTQQATCQLFENWYQYSKVYSVDQADISTFFQRRAQGFASTKPKSGVITLCAYHDGKYLDYLASREYYVMKYVELARASTES